MGDKATRPRGAAAAPVTIRKPGKACAKCGTAFQDGDQHYSILKHDETEQAWVRRDYCLECWGQVLDSEDGCDVHSLWRTRYVDRDAARRTPVNEYTPLLEICYDALHEQDTTQHGLAYLSAMVLRRQKVFRLVRTVRDQETEQASLLFFDRVNQAEVQVPDPPMTLEELRATRRVLQSRLTPIEPLGREAPDPEVAHDRD